jgi:hypothetical protein
MSLEVLQGRQRAGGEMGQSEVVKMKLSAGLRMMSIMSEAAPATQPPITPKAGCARRSGALRDCRGGPCGTSRGSALRRSGTCHSRRCFLKMRLKASPRRPAFGRNIDIGRINVEPTEAPSGPLGCHERRSGAQKKSSTRSPRRVTSWIASATSPVGL